MNATQPLINVVRAHDIKVFTLKNGLNGDLYVYFTQFKKCS